MGHDTGHTGHWMGRTGAWLGGFSIVGRTSGVWAAAQEAEHQPGIINLDFSLVLQGINFLILLAILYKFLFKPLQSFMAGRAQGIKQSLEQAEEARRQAARAMEEYQRQLQATRQETAQLRERMEREIAEERQRLMARSQEESQKLVAQAKADIEQQVKRAKAEIQGEVVNLALLAAEKLVSQTLREEDHRRLVERSIQDLSGRN
ncbi:MAG: F0F1 ATP synthase subunit B [Candidatus Methylomirabilales bacterium]